MINLSESSYGKSKVRLGVVDKSTPRHDYKEMTIEVLLHGQAFAAAYTASDNRQVIPTDTIKNLVYILARNYGVASIESFALTLGRHFIKQYAQVEMTEVSIEQLPWSRLTIDGSAHNHSFAGSSKEQRRAHARVHRQACVIQGGLAELELLKTTGSGFQNFCTDEFTTLRPAADRVTATSVEATWEFTGTDHDFDNCHARIRQALCDVWAKNYSPSVQRTIWDMGTAALEAVADITQISLRCPNLHHFPFDLEPFGLKNNNEILVPWEEPQGVLSGTIKRE